MPRKPAKAKAAKTATPETVSAPSKTLTTLLLDRSGSMQSLHAQTLAAINGWLGELRGSGEDIRLSLVQFDHADGAMQLEKTHVARRIAEVPDLAGSDFRPRGTTPLIDAAMETIAAIRASLEGRADVKVVMAIQTDGHENASRRFRWEDLRREIAAREAEGWEFVFMGAGLGRDTYAMGARMGIAAEKTLSYGTDMEATRTAFRETGRNTAMYASGAAMSMAYTSLQKSASGDVFEDAGEQAPSGPLHAHPRAGEMHGGNMVLGGTPPAWVVRSPADLSGLSAPAPQMPNRSLELRPDPKSFGFGAELNVALDEGTAP
jgi:hypothetical protein